MTGSGAAPAAALEVGTQGPRRRHRACASSILTASSSVRSTASAMCSLRISRECWRIASRSESSSTFLAPRPNRTWPPSPKRPRARSSSSVLDVGPSSRPVARLVRRRPPRGHPRRTACPPPHGWRRGRCRASAAPRRRRHPAVPTASARGAPRASATASGGEAVRGEDVARTAVVLGQREEEVDGPDLVGAEGPSRGPGSRRRRCGRRA